MLRDEPEPMIRVSSSVLVVVVLVVVVLVVVALVDSYAFLTPSREFWFAKSWQNRIRHVDPPRRQSFSATEAHAASQSR